MQLLDITYEDDSLRKGSVTGESTWHHPVVGRAMRHQRMRFVWEHQTVRLRHWAIAEQTTSRMVICHVDLHRAHPSSEVNYIPS